MFFFNGNNSWRIDNAKTVTKKCLNCNNTGEHYAIGCFSGLHIGFIFQPTSTRLGPKKYFLVCPVCGQPSKELSKLELEHLKKV